MRSSTSGWRVSRSSVQARPVAVVSCPASSSVISWSRTSRSLIAEPSSKRACDEQRADVRRRAPRGARRSRPAAARRSPPPSRCSRSSGLRAPEQHRDLQLRRDRRPTAGRAGGRAAAPRSDTPKTARRITSSVIACMLGCTANALAHGPARRARARRPRRRPARRRASGRRGTAAASPCGATGDRRPRAAAASAGRPAAAASTVRPGGSSCARSAYSARIASGEETITSGVLKPCEVDAERVAVAPPAVLHERDRPQQPARGLERRAARSDRPGSITARCTRPGRVSSASAAASAMSSRHGCAATCTPIGSPSADVPQRTVAAGQPVSECERRVATVRFAISPWRGAGARKHGGEDQVEALAEAQHRLRDTHPSAAAGRTRSRRRRRSPRPRSSARARRPAALPPRRSASASRQRRGGERDHAARCRRRAARGRRRPAPRRAARARAPAAAAAPERLRRRARRPGITDSTSATSATDRASGPTCVRGSLNEPERPEVVDDAGQRHPPRGRLQGREPAEVRGQPHATRPSRSRARTPTRPTRSPPPRRRSTRRRCASSVVRVRRCAR